MFGYFNLNLMSVLEKKVRNKEIHGIIITIVHGLQIMLANLQGMVSIKLVPTPTIMSRTRLIANVF